MSTARFTHIGLRTKDVPGATEFYRQVFGRPILGVFELPAPAAARGAPSHWLGFIGLPSQESFQTAVNGFLARGATRLGPDTDRAGAAVLRDPGGATVALAARVSWPSETAAWHQLLTANAAGTAAHYAALFGWSLEGTVDCGPYGVHRLVAWSAGEPPAATIGDTAGRPELHPHWAFYFAVPDLDASLALIPKLGGTTIGQMRLTDGTRIAAFEDPQGAEFGLLHRP